jgi:hypothetical protein
MCEIQSLTNSYIFPLRHYCAAEQLPSQLRYEVSQSTVPQSSYPLNRNAKCLSPLCRRAATLSAAVQSALFVRRSALCLHSKSVSL